MGTKNDFFFVELWIDPYNQTDVKKRKKNTKEHPYVTELLYLLAITASVTSAIKVPS